MTLSHHSLKQFTLSPLLTGNVWAMLIPGKTCSHGMSSVRETILIRFCSPLRAAQNIYLDTQTCVLWNFSIDRQLTEKEQKAVLEIRKNDIRACKERPQRRRSVLKHGGLIIHKVKHILLFSKMSFALFVCTNKLLCNVYRVQCVRNRLMTMQEEAVV